MSDSADRELAARLLVRVAGGAYSSRLLAAAVSPGLRSRVLGVLRWQRALDAALAVPLRRPLDRLDEEVLAALRIGLFEAVKLGVPAAVATDAAVRLVGRLGKRSASGLVNAVLRRAPAVWASESERWPADVALSHPAWLATRWRGHFGAPAANAAMAADQEPAPVWAWWLDEEVRRTAAESGLELRPHPWCPGAWSADPPGALLAAVAAGDAYVQDPSSQLVAVVAHRLGETGARRADLCAAPGGKLARWGGLGGSPVPFGMDRSLKRVRLMEGLLGRVGGGRLVAGDAARPPLAPRSLDVVLVDAPCTGTGTLRRHPELRWRLRPESIDELSAVQRGIVRGALELAAPHGTVLYTTCSIEPEENEGLLSPIPEGFEAVDLAQVLPAGVPWIATSAGGIRILPHVDGDGFTMHAVKRMGPSLPNSSESSKVVPGNRTQVVES